jgi:hypothetical protein
VGSRHQSFFNSCSWGWDEPAYSSGTANSSPGSLRAKQQGDCPAAGPLSFYSAEASESNYEEAGAEEPGSGGLPGRAAGEYCGVISEPPPVRLAGLTTGAQTLLGSGNPGTNGVERDV